MADLPWLSLSHVSLLQSHATIAERRSSSRMVVRSTQRMRDVREVRFKALFPKGLHSDLAIYAAVQLISGLDLVSTCSHHVVHLQKVLEHLMVGAGLREPRQREIVEVRRHARNQEVDPSRKKLLGLVGPRHCAAATKQAGSTCVDSAGLDAVR